ncbi:MAG: zinc ribbon domain-containing protein [Candidatus Moraniibacteriota bacterium]
METQQIEQTKKCSACGENVLKSAKKCKHCQADLRGWINRHPLLTFVLIIIGIAFFPILMASLSSDTSQSIKPIANQGVVKNEELKSAPLDEQLTKQIETISTFKGDDYRGSIEKINNEVLLITFWSGLIKQAKNNNDANIKKLGKDLETKLIQLQVKEFPKMRADYGKLVGKTLWEHDVDVTISGSGNSTIEFSGALFAANKNIKDAQTAIQDMLKQLRFDKANYRWYSGASEYDYYTIESSKDNEIVIN